ncbi:MAG TPA: MFS transporter [Candidatus Bathyarchaeia archaeon]|nr:MFS transporter [Candidatus Bathyarchaeia archaeon]
MKTPGVARQTLLGMWSFQFLTMMRRGVFYSFMYIYLFSLLGNVTSTAALGTLTMLMSAIGQNALWGRISDRQRMRAQLVVIGEATAGLTYIAVFFLHKYYIDARLDLAAGFSLVIGLAILEFFWSMSDVGWASLVTDITTPATRGSFVGGINFIMSIGRMTGIILAGSLYADGLGFRQGTIFYIVSVMLFIGAFIMWLVAKNIKPAPETRSTDSTQESDSAKDARSRNKPQNEKAFRWFLVALTIVVLGVASTGQVFPLFLKLNQGLHATDLEVSFILSAWTLGGMLASIIAGRMADVTGRTSVILTGLLIAAATPLFYGLVPNVVVIGIVYGINGIAFMTLQTAGFALAGDIIPEHRRGRLLSRYNTVMALSWGPAGLLIGGPLADIQTGILNVPVHAAYVNAFLASSLLVLAGTFVFFVKVRRQT